MSKVAEKPKNEPKKDVDGITTDEIFLRTRIAQPDIFHSDDLPFEVAPVEKSKLTPKQKFNQLLEMASYLDKKDKEKLTKAYEYSFEAHKEQKRKSGEPYIIHPLEVAIILADLRMDVDTLCGALLHDTVEDTETTSKAIVELFGYDVALLVEGVTKITRIEVGSVSESQALTLRKMFVAMSNDLRVIIIKLADRLHNMRTLGALKEDRRIFKANETLEIFAPIAHRLGMDSMKWELEDLSFYYLEPEKYKQVAQMVIESRDQRIEYLQKVMKILQDEMDGINISCHIMGRPKHLYSIYCKMKNKGKEFSEIYDLIAVRIIVTSVKDCYGALGAVHSLWSPIPGRFKDYIAIPKFNMYQSLHTSVIGPAGRPLEVQIRTEEMHKTSEYGIAAHWRYKEKSTASDKALDQQLAWLREMVDWQDETSNSQEMLKSLKVDLADSEVYVFTPEGEAKSLRRGSTPVDFAYSVHTEVGHHCVGAKVNGNIVPLTYELKTSDRVEILTQKSSSPSRDWLNFVKTPGARSKIRSYLSKVTRDDDLQKGHDMLVNEMRKNGVGLSSAQANRSIKELADKLGFKKADDLLINIGSGKESVKNIANKLLKMMVDNGDKPHESDIFASMEKATGVMPKMVTNVKQLREKSAHTNNGIVVKGIDDVLVRLSKCCNPVPGDEIVGFITRGRGVSVHRASCPNSKDLLNHPERIIHVEWDNQPSKKVSYKINIAVIARDRMGLLGEISTVLSEMGLNIITFSASTQKDQTTKMKFVFQASDMSVLEKVDKELRKIDGVINVFRTTN